MGYSFQSKKKLINFIDILSCMVFCISLLLHLPPPHGVWKTSTVINTAAIVTYSQCTAVLALNISAAFDGVDHTTLTDRAHTVFGIHDVALDWLWSFITEQTQQIAVGSEKSAMFPSRFRTDPF